RVAPFQRLALQKRLGEALAVPLGGQVAGELGDQQPPVRENQDAERAGRFDEAGGGDRLARRGRVAEAEAARRTGVLGHRRRLVLVGLVRERLVLLVLV